MVTNTDVGVFGEDEPFGITPNPIDHFMPNIDGTAFNDGVIPILFEQGS